MKLSDNNIKHHQIRSISP